MGAHPRSCESVAAALESEDESVTLNGKLANLRSNKLQKTGGSKFQKAGCASDGTTGVHDSSNESQNRHLGDDNGVTVKMEERRAIEDSGSSESKNEDGNAPKAPPTCSECGKAFPSLKALYGHLRCHPQRGYRGAYRPLDAENKLQTSASAPAMRVDEAALILMHMSMQMSRDARYLGPIPGLPLGTNRSQDRKRKDISNDIIIVMDEEVILGKGKALQLINAIHSESSDEIEDNNDRSHSEFERKLKKVKVRAPEASQAARSGRYRCSACNKSFSTHQALGGHKASHNKGKSNAELVVAEDGELADGDGEELVDSNGVVPGAATGEHRCTLCQATFPTGQALGGHKRKHWNGPLNHSTPRAASLPAPSSKKVEKANSGLLDFDLNELPKFEAEEP